MRNCLASRKLNWRTPEERLTGITPDISVFRFHFWQEIEYFDTMEKNPHDGWKPGRFLGINECAGDDMTYYIEVKSPSGRPVVISRSNIRPKPQFTSTQSQASPSGENEVNDDNISIGKGREDMEINRIDNHHKNEVYKYSCQTQRLYGALRKVFQHNLLRYI